MELKAVEIDPDILERYRLKLRYKVCYHLGGSCADVDDVVQETLTRFLRALEDSKIRNPDSTAAFLSGICNNVIREYRRRMWKEPLIDPDLAPERPAPPEADVFGLRQVILSVTYCFYSALAIILSRLSAIGRPTVWRRCRLMAVCPQRAAQ